MEKYTLVLDGIWEIIKIIGVPIVGFIAVRFINSIDKLRKDVNSLITQMRQRETYCTGQHHSISEHLKRHDDEIENINDDLREHGESISKVKGILKIN